MFLFLFVFEGFLILIVEVMMVGVFVIVICSGGFEEIILSVEVGYLIFI